MRPPQASGLKDWKEAHKLPVMIPFTYIMVKSRYIQNSGQINAVLVSQNEVEHVILN
jgi:hypothetical protein